MRLGIRAHDTKYAPLDEMVANIHNMGFHCMHIALAKSIKEFKPEIETMTPGLAMYMKEICRKNDVDVAVLGCYLNLCNPDPEQHKKLTGQDNALILRNLAAALSSSTEVRVRMPLMPGLNDSDENLAAMAAFLGRFGRRQVEIMPCHAFGKSKYAALGKPYPDVQQYTPEGLKAAEERFARHGLVPVIV